MEYHIPVLLQQCIDALNIRPGKTYVDATFGGGGHSKIILQNLDAKGHLFGFDQDEDVLPNLISENERFTFIHHNFKYLKRFLKLHGVQAVDGILADLGVSSHQLDQAERGFSYRFEASLDMRMNQQGDVTAADIVNSYSPEALEKVFSQYGEVRNSRTLAHAICKNRQKAITTIGDFLLLIDPYIRGNKPRYLSQVFQALRIEVNDEIGALKTFLTDALEVLAPGGRLVIMSYHSLEDRLVKNFFKSGSFEGEHQKDFYGNIYRPFKVLTKKAIAPSEEEIRQNPRARSARLRIAEKQT